MEETHVAGTRLFSSVREAKIQLFFGVIAAIARENPLRPAKLLKTK
jgi:hypothetical protein